VSTFPPDGRSTCESIASASAGRGTSAGIEAQTRPKERTQLDGRSMKIVTGS
jgi:hypothetical protein